MSSARRSVGYIILLQPGPGGRQRERIVPEVEGRDDRITIFTWDMVEISLGSCRKQVVMFHGEALGRGIRKSRQIAVMAVASDDGAGIVDQTKMYSSVSVVPGRQADENFVGARMTDM